MDGSILNDIKKLIGIKSTDINYDTDIIIFINSVFTDLNQMGVGPSDKPYSITDDKNKWSEFVEEGMLENVKKYIYLRVKVVFDPPTNSFLLNSMKEETKEMEWRLNVRGESIKEKINKDNYRDWIR